MEIIDTDVLVIGAGFGGIAVAVELRRAGIHDVVVLEAADDVGGVWRENTYPGAGCDVPSPLYSFSFAPNPAWPRRYALQPDILAYLRRVARRFGVYNLVRFRSEVTSAEFDAETGRWSVRTSDGAEYSARVLVPATGQLSRPVYPSVPGTATFTGPSFHSARWDHDFDLRGKRVAVVGTGASAIQFVPKIAEQVRQLHLFQRTPPWVMPKADHTMPEWVKRLFARVPLAQRAYRDFLYWTLELRAIGFNGDPRIMRLAQKIAKRHLDRQVADPVLREKLTPDYVLGCKRVLISNDYYPALTRDNVEVVTDGIAEVTETSVIDKAGVEREVDAIIYGTGFHVTDGYDHLDIVGANGTNLGRQWSEHGMQTHLGITANGYPNLFLLLGPNTGLGHNSVVFMIEQQIRYIAEAMNYVEAHGADAIEVRADAQAQFNADIQRKLANGIWTRGGCKSWYLDSQGVNRTIWPGFTWRYWLRTRKLDPSDFRLSRRATASPRTVSSAA